MSNGRIQKIAELDQALSHNLASLRDHRRELVTLVEGDGQIMGRDLGNIARLAAAAVTLLLGIGDLEEDGIQC